MSSRRALHSGSWYSNDSNELNKQLDGYITKPPTHPNTCAFITPHAGYSYSAKTAGFSFSTFNPDTIKTAFILGPSHKVYLRGCALSTCSIYETPLGNLNINVGINKDLLSRYNKFKTMDINTDQNEHSIEMQLPYLQKLMSQKKDFTIVPVLVGEIRESDESYYADIFSSYFNDPSVLFVISSDFCHWGKRFDFTCGMNDSSTPIYKSIENLDFDAINIIQNLDCASFRSYLLKTKNTICGRNPILLLLKTIETLGTHNFSAEFLFYDQSSQVLSKGDSSVSYVALTITRK